ncbi:sigma-54 dependent transcriptional regulator [Maritimibacter sp. UBA3975]|uniref:sigma-54-dependent transcriptional regulator n=1 Tax=Maritimibacter sp. UBA3975 TaxID=1946833 RepID=UPI000C0B0D6C|nr:sigma-54 dependent transcriptional regulator [Maritimibacter sp. UBA3975]MAM63591.1 sigma-54-dependent Fis family transcriptional regulator [Maritimibacter sp.]|tara:strand:+ start:14982 stop:16208 length:1227 start_codon:yes stop_codon:yes gene_type:complete
MTRRVLLVDDDAAVREALGQTLELADLAPVLAGSYIEAKDHVTAEFAGVVVSDIRMPGKDGFALLDFIHDADPELPVILLTGEGDVPTAVRGMAAGAFDFLEKPCAPADFLAVVEKALKTRALVLENRSLKAQVEAGDAAARLLRGTSALSEKMRADARAVARTMADVLITGEPGVGTSKMAEVVHLLSAQSRGPFIKIAGAGTTPDSLAATFEDAEGGSIFVDEVAGMSQPTQFALLERLETPAAPRVFAGTYQDLAAMADRGTFNPDLYYRLEAARIHIPPLKERREDIPVLFRHYVEIACEQAALPMPEIPTEVTQRLMSKDWPGNARALMNAAMRYAMGIAEPVGDGDIGLAERMAEVERAFLIEALRNHGGQATEAARSLKLPRKTFYDKLARHGIKPEDFRI